MAASMNILETDSEKLLAAVRELLATKGVASSAEIAERIAITDAANPGQGARMVAKAWTDPAYRSLMLADGTKAGGAQPRGLHAVQLLSTGRARLSAVLVQVSRLPCAWCARPARPAGRMGHRAARRREDPRRRFHRGLSLDGAAAAPSGHRGVERRKARLHRARG
jgi:hypothetical protein